MMLRIVRTRLFHHSEAGAPSNGISTSMHIGIHGRMLRHMRTTVILPDELYRQAKTASQAAGRTFTSFLEQAIRRELAQSRVGPVDVHLAPPSGSREHRPLVDVNDKDAVQELLDEDDFAVQQLRASRSAGGSERGHA